MKRLLLFVLAACGLASAQNNPNVGPANLAGLLYASNFAQWTVQQGDQGSYSWSNSDMCKVHSAGADFYAFTTGVPVLIVDTGNPAHNETVTPSNVNIGTSGCSISVHPNYVHNSFYFRSATAGLNEALVFAGQQNYEIWLTPDWQRLGGTTGLITSAKGNTSVTIMDARSSVLVPYTWGGSAYAAGSFGGGGLPSGTTGQTVYYAANGTTGTAVTNGLIVPPSGDTTGATDGVNIGAACTSVGAVQLTSGAYHVGASNTVITLSAPCKIAGQGISTVVTNHGTTNDIFRISYFTTWAESPWVYPSSTNQTEISNMQFAQSGTPTAGYVFDIGSGIAQSGGTYSYTMNVHIHDTVINGTWGGAKFVSDQLYASLDNNMWRQFVGGGCIFYNAEVGSGDNHFGPNMECSGLTNSGIIIAQSDVQHFVGVKLNGSGISFTGAGPTKSVIFDDVSVETGIAQPCAIDFGTGSAPVNTQFTNSEQYGFTQAICHPGNNSGFAFAFNNSSATSDFAAGLITNNGYATVTLASYQDFASFIGTAATLLSAYTTTSPGSGKTFALYSSAAGTTIPQLNGSGAAYLPSGTDSTFGDSLDSLTPATANYSVGITCTKISGNPTIGVFARAASGSNTNYAFQWDSGGPNLDVYAQFSGTFAQIMTSSFAWANGDTHTLVLKVSGTTISASVDGTPITGSPVTDSHVASTGQAGFRITGGGHATCTNFYVQ